MDSESQQNLEPDVKIAVIGDVGTDWAFISSQPSRRRSPAFQPWTQYPATHLFAFPGGAWFSGHAIQGAVADAIFKRTFTTSTSQQENTPENCARHVVLTATKLEGTYLSSRRNRLPQTKYELPEKFIIHVPFSHGTMPYSIILDDAIELNLLEYFSQQDFGNGNPLQIELRIVSEGIGFKEQAANARLQAGLLDATLIFQDEFSPKPGRIYPDPIFRRYEAESFALEFSDRLTLTFLCLDQIPIELSLTYGEAHLPVKGTFRSIRIVPPRMRHGEFIHVPELTIETSPKGSGPLWFRQGYIDVTFGSLELKTTTSDAGKLTPPQKPVEVNPDSHPLSVTFTAVSAASDHVRHKIWFYSHPRPLLSMQHPGHIVHTLSELDRYKRHRDQKSPTKVYRRKAIHGIDGPLHGYPTILNNYKRGTYVLASPSPASEEKPDLKKDWNNGTASRLVVIDDEGTGFSSRHNLWSPFLWDDSEHKLSGEEAAFFESFIKKVHDEKGRQRFNEYLKSTFIVVKSAHWLNPPRSTLVSFISGLEVSKRAVLVISAESLRGGLVSLRDTPGVKLSRTLSWERTLEDFEAAIADKRLSALHSFSHIVVRLGLEGAIIWSRGASPDAHPTLTLKFDPSRIEGEYTDADELGQFPGLTSIFTAALVREIAIVLSKDAEIERATDEIGKTLPSAAEYALQCARRYFDIGYGPTPDTVRKFEHLHLPLSQVFSRDILSGGVSSGRHSFATFRKSARSKDGGNVKDGAALTSVAPVNILQERLTEKGEQIPETVYQNLVEQASDHPALTRAANALILARQIVRDGAHNAVQMRGNEVPFARFGRLLTVDRKEIEGLRSIRNLLREYMHHPERNVPLSLAVFGPPGSGKSFGVQQIAEGLAKDKIRKFVFNLAQFQSFQDVSRLLLQVRDAGIDHKLPLVFFDEFDSPLGTQPLGWLKFFLAPMQDGRFQHDESMLGIGKAIFVFAGGIAPTHADFMDHDNFWTRKYNVPDLFRSAKVSDFHSRLRGFLDISGTNPNFVTRRQAGVKTACADDVPAEKYRDEDFAYVLRRALLIRQFIERMSEESTAQLLDEEGRVDIDGDVLDALLLTEEYRHGVRSIEALFEMSHLYGERIITKTSLPAPHQLDMHVDGSFVKILTRNHTQSGSRVIELALKYVQGRMLETDSDRSQWSSDIGETHYYRHHGMDT